MANPYRDPPEPPPRWYRVKGVEGFILNLNDVYVCKWDRDSRGAHLNIAFRHGSWSWDGFWHNSIRVYGEEATELERALLYMHER